MLANAKITAALPAQDLDRAVAFYTDTLGLPSSASPGASPGERRFQGADGEFVVFESSGRASGTHTQMAFTVEDVDAAAAELRARGVVFEVVDGMDQTDGIATIGPVRGGWFKDSEGNLLGLVQELE